MLQINQKELIWLILIGCITVSNVSAYLLQL